MVNKNGNHKVFYLQMQKQQESGVDLSVRLLNLLPVKFNGHKSYEGGDIDF